MIKSISPATRRPALPLLLSLTALWSCPVPRASAAAFTWDVDGAASAATGGSGDWDLTNLFWNDGTALWGNTNVDEAVFGGFPGTVITTTAAPVTANKLTFMSTGYTLAGDFLTMAGTAPSIFVGLNESLDPLVPGTPQTLLVKSVLSGTAGLTKAGAGILNLGVNASGATLKQEFTGGLTVNGTLALFGASVQNVLNGNAVTLNDASTLQSTLNSVRVAWGTGGISLPASASATVRTDWNGSGNGGRDHVLGSGTANATANPVTFSNLTAAAGATLRFDLYGGIACNLRAGTRGTQTIGNRILLGNTTTAITSLGTPTAANPALTGSGTLTKTGNGVLQLNSSGAASPFTGAINITGGSVRISGADALDGMAPNRVTVAPGAAIDYQVQLSAARLDKVAVLPAGAVERWTFNSPRVSTATPSTVPPGAILQIASDQTFATGRTITLSEGSVMEPFTAASNASNLAGRYTLNTIPVILAGNAFLGRSGVLPGLSGNNGLGPATGSITGGPEIRHIGTIAGPFGITKQGADTYTLGSAGNLSTYTGLTNITGGTLRLNVTNAIKPGNDLTVDSPGNPFGYYSTGTGANVTHTGATPGFDLAGFSQTIGVLNGSGTIGNLYGTLPGVLTVASGNFTGTITEAPALATDLNAQFGGTTALVKTGPGTLVLTGANTYSGGTTISGGILAINSDAALGLPGGGTLAIPAITNAGTGYTSIPMVTVTGGDGTGGTATASMGGLTARVVLAGSGYTAAPTITISGGGGSGMKATAVLGTGAAADKVASITITAAGNGYITAPDFIFSSGDAIAELATFRVRGLSLTSGTGYFTSPPLLTIAAPPTGTTAAATTGVTGLLTFEGGTLRCDGPVTSARAIRLGTLGGILDTNSQDVSCAGSLSGPGSLTKTGSGTLTLSAPNTYTGQTSVEAGTLSLVQRTLADDNDVRLLSAATLNLAFAGTDSIRSLYLDGVLQATGTWGSLTSSAINKTARITGPGLLNVAIGSSGGGGGFSTWASGFSLTGLDAAPSADPDKDGIPNALEYVMGTSPAASNPGGLTVTTGGGNITVTFPRKISSKTPDTATLFQTGTTLGAWPGSYLVGADTASSTAGVTITPGATGFETVTLTLPIGSDPVKFARLKVTITP
jgi:fibronectin-binding autotransporter adhesin